MAEATKYHKYNITGRLLAYIFNIYRSQMVTAMICIILSAVASVAGTAFLQRLIDDCVTPGLLEGIDAVWPKLVGIIVSMSIVYIAGTVASFVYTRIMATVTQGTLDHMRKDMFYRMETLPIRFFDTHARGDIMSTYTNDTDAIRQMIGQSIPQLVSSLLTILVIFILMMYYSVPLTIVVVAFMVIMLFQTKRLGGGSAKYMVEQQRSLAEEEGFIEEMMGGQKVVKVFCHEEQSKKDFVKHNEDLFRNSERANQYGNTLMPTLGNIGNLLYVCLAVVGGFIIYLSSVNATVSSISTLTAGILISFLSMARQLSQTLAMASNQVSMISMGIAGAGRVFDMMDEEPEEDEGYVELVHARRTANHQLEETNDRSGIWAWKHYHREKDTTTYVPLQGEIVFVDVDFGYIPDHEVLHDIMLYALPGEKIAFVGGTGAGKTTITNLINRFYDITDGKIRYDGINVRKIKKADLRRSLGIVLQEVSLFSGTIMDNIRYGRLDATDEECIAAAKLANADAFIQQLPDGYQTMLAGNGSSLSQGQRQLLSIARAAVADPPVMIMDEATSSIDTMTEAQVQAGMDNLMAGRTTFVIAHRLSTVRNSDVICVLDHGRIVERGSHDQLIAKKGTYYQLYTGAFELE